MPVPRRGLPQRDTPRINGIARIACNAGNWSKSSNASTPRVTGWAGVAPARCSGVHRGSAKDGGYGVSPSVMHDSAGAVLAVLATRPLDTFRQEVYDISGAKPQKPVATLKTASVVCSPE